MPDASSELDPVDNAESEKLAEVDEAELKASSASRCPCRARGARTGGGSALYSFNEHSQPGSLRRLRLTVVLPQYGTYRTVDEGV